MKHRNDRRRIGFLVFPGVTALDFIGPMDAFAAAFIDDGDGNKHPGYELVTIGIDRKPVVAESGLTITPDHDLDSAPPLDTVLVPGGRGLRDPATNAQVANWLATRAKRIRRIASVCTGIYGLAASGLLDGRRVTTHWAFARGVAQRFPKLTVDAEALFIKDGAFYTSAGVTSGIDLSLALIEEDFGSSVALSVARELVVYMKRAGGQTQYSEPLRFQAQAGDRFADLATWILANLQRPLSIEVLAKRSGVGERHFSRRFKETFHVTPASFIEHHRLDEARKRLGLPRATVKTVSAAVGFRSADAFRRAFERRFGISPSGYRGRFGAPVK